MGGLWGGGGWGWGIFESQVFFSLSNSFFEFISAVAWRFIRFNWRARILLRILLRIPCANIFFVLRPPPPPPHKFSTGHSLTTLMTPPLRRLKLSCDLWGRIFCLTPRRKKQFQGRISYSRQMLKNSLYTDVSLFTEPLFSLLSPSLSPCASGRSINFPLFFITGARRIIKRK